MSLAQPSSPKDQAKAFHGRYMGGSELAAREVVTAWGRARWPQARMVTELTVDRGTSRADVAFIGTDHLAVVEVKSSVDNTSRVLHQLGHFQLSSPEVWLAFHTAHLVDAHRIKSIMPSIGLLALEYTEPGASRWSTPKILPAEQRTATIIAEAVPFKPDPECLLSVLWVEELAEEAGRMRVMNVGKKRPSHGKLVKALMGLSVEEQTKSVCRQLRARDAMWKADPPIREALQ